MGLSFFLTWPPNTGVSVTNAYRLRFPMLYSLRIFPPRGKKVSNQLKYAKKGTLSLLFQHLTFLNSARKCHSVTGLIFSFGKGLSSGICNTHYY